METQKITICDETNFELCNKDICSLCLCSIKKGDKILETMCHHYFHNKCFSDYVLFNYKKNKKEESTCPLCTLDATDDDYYFMCNRENFINKYCNIKIGEQVIAKTFGNVKFKVTGFQAVYLGKRVLKRKRNSFYSDNRIIHYYKKFYQGTINGYINVSLQRKDIDKVKLDKCIIECHNCEQKSFSDYLDIDDERLNKNYKEYYKINNITNSLDYLDDNYQYEKKTEQHYVINHETEYSRHDGLYYSSFNVEDNKCSYCNSTSTKICSYSTRS
jgi:hypothetical protein